MTYVPNNLDVYTAAYTSCLSSATAADKQPTSQVPASYAVAASVAGAFAQSFDTEWGVTPLTQVELDAIESIVEAAWFDRGPSSIIPSTYSSLCRALIAIVKQAAVYYASQGITSPLVPASAPQPFGMPDYIVVGLGTAGAPLAKYLSDNMTTKVLVLEQGIDLSNDPGVQKGAPFGDFTAFSDPKRSESWFTTVLINGQDSGEGGTSTGRMWGGSSGHNYLQAVRSSNNVYDNWATASGDASWSYNGLLDIMKGLEHYTSNGSPVNPAERGTAGPLFITQDQQNSFNPFGPPGNSAPLLAAMAAGTNAPLRDDYNNTPTTDPTCNVSTGVTQWFTTPTDNERSFSASAFMNNTIVDPVTGLGVGGRKLQVVSGATVTRVVIENTVTGPKAVGVLYYLNANPNEVIFAQVTTKVVLCGGALTDPAILQRSGIGDAALLAALGIPVYVNNPNVGKNLQNHFSPVFLFPADNNPLNNPSFFQFLSGYTDLSGTADHPTTRPHDSVRRCQFVTVLGGNFLPPTLTILLPPINPFGTIGGFSFLIAPESRGELHIVSNDALTKPQINFNFLDPAFPNDELDMIASLKMMANASLAFTGNMPIWPLPSHYPIGAHPNYGPEGGTAAQITIIGLTGMNPGAVGQTIVITDGASPNAGAWTVDSVIDATSVTAVALNGAAAIDPVSRTWILPALGGAGAAAQVSAVNGSDFQLTADGLTVNVLAAHPAGTCIMGTSAANAVVDHNLDVFGVSGLAVASNAVLPQITTGNTAYPAYVVGMKKALIEGAIVP